MPDLSQRISYHRTLLMGFSMVCLVLYHQLWGCGIRFFDVMHLIGNFGVEIFFFLSGFGIAHSLSRNTSVLGFYKRRALRIYTVGIIVGVMKLFLSYGGIRDAFYYNYHWSLRLFSLDYWFLYAVTIYYLITPLFSRIKSGTLLVIISACMFVLGSLLSFDGRDFAFVKWLPFVFNNLPIYILGFWLYSHKIDFGWIKCVFGLICFAGWCIMKYINMIEMTHISGLGLLMLPFSLSLSWLSPYLDSALTKLRAKELFLYIGKCSLEVYLWHAYFFTYFNS